MKWVLTATVAKGFEHESERGSCVMAEGLALDSRPRSIGMDHCVVAGWIICELFDQ